MATSGTKKSILNRIKVQQGDITRLEVDAVAAYLEKYSGIRKVSFILFFEDDARIYQKYLNSPAVISGSIS